MFNFPSLFGKKDSAATPSDQLAAAKAQATKAGFSPEVLDEIMVEMKKLSEDTTKTQEEKIQLMREMFLAKGFPAQAVNMAIMMLRSKLK